MRRVTVFRPVLIALAGAVLALALTGCQPTVSTRGNLISDVKLAKIQPGVSSKYEVAAVWGPPSSIAAFDPNTWFYIGQTTEEMGIFKHETVKSRIIKVTFDENEVVTDISEAEDAQDIRVVNRRTPTAGKEPGVMKQFLGNLGKFNSPPRSSIPQ